MNRGISGDRSAYNHFPQSSPPESACCLQRIYLMIEPVVRIRIELLDVRQEIWRRVDVPASSTLAMLHHIIQAAMGWEECHLHEFQIEGRTYTEIMPGLLEDYGVRRYDEKNLRLKTIFERGIRRMLYVYDFGDDWRHDIRIEGIRMGDAEVRYPALVEGAGRCPPEDVGGWIGFERFLQVLSDSAHEEHEELVEWCGGAFDPDDFDTDQARRWVGSIAARRPAATAKPDSTPASQAPNNGSARVLPQAGASE